MPHPTRKAPHIGKYRLGREIGSGGSATVHLAYDAQLGRWVALKVLHERFIRQPIRVADFLTQAHHTARLDHPNVVAVLDIDTRARRPWIAMEFLSGRSLAATLRARRSPGKSAAQPYDLTEALRMVRDVSAGLAHAHRHSVIHYDVSPGNVMQAPCGGLTLIDFGLPPLRRHRQGSAAAIRGTTHFMAPEQVVDDPGTPATDVYAAGCLFYALVTGVPPFLGPDAGSVMRSHLNDTPKSAREHRPDLPAWVDDLFATLLAKKPTDRPLDGTALYELLDEASRKLCPGAPPGCGAHSGRRQSPPELVEQTMAAAQVRSSRRPHTAPQLTEPAGLAHAVGPAQSAGVAQSGQQPEHHSQLGASVDGDHDMFSEPDLMVVAGAPLPESSVPTKVTTKPAATEPATTEPATTKPAQNQSGQVSRNAASQVPVDSVVDGANGQPTANAPVPGAPVLGSPLPDVPVSAAAKAEPQPTAEPQHAAPDSGEPSDTTAARRDSQATPENSRRLVDDASPPSRPADTGTPRYSERRAAKAARLAAEQRQDPAQQTVSAVVLPDAGTASQEPPKPASPQAPKSPTQPAASNAPAAAEPKKPKNRSTSANLDTGSGGAAVAINNPRTGRPANPPHLPAGTPTTGQMRVKAPKGRPTLIPDVDVCVEPVRVVDELSPKTIPAA